MSSRCIHVVACARLPFLFSLSNTPWYTHKHHMLLILSSTHGHGLLPPLGCHECECAHTQGGIFTRSRWRERPCPRSQDPGLQAGPPTPMQCWAHHFLHLIRTLLLPLPASLQCDEAEGGSDMKPRGIVIVITQWGEGNDFPKA